MTDVIELRGLRLLRGDRRRWPKSGPRPSPSSVDLDVARPFAEAAANDDVAATTELRRGRRAWSSAWRRAGSLLLETLAYRVARGVLALDPEIESVTVAVRKV